jgi:2,4-dienoyl-CoA reductase-like NADH-dependent reductase (Old Yellow Enzyme family)
VTRENNYGDAIAFGRLFIANPDFVRRIKESRPLNASPPFVFRYITSPRPSREFAPMVYSF